MQINDLRQIVLYFGAPFGVRGAFFFEIAQVDKRVELFSFFTDRFTDFDSPELDQRPTG